MRIIKGISMTRTITTACLIFLAPFLASCGDEWSCQTKGDTIYSVNSSGEIGAANKGCSCDDIRAFELRKFGRVDEEALKSDFGCK